MNKTKFLWIIILMSISLGGIILVQILWIKNAVEIREKQFDRQIIIAMQNAVDKLERKATIMFIEGNEPTINIDSLGLKMQGELIEVQFSDTIQNSQIIVTNSAASNKEVKVKMDSLICKTDLNDNVEMTHNVYISTSDSTNVITIDSKKVKRKIKRFNNVVTEWIVESEVTKDPIGARIKTSNISELLQNEFENANLLISFDYGVIDKMNDTITKYRSEGFNNEDFTTKYQVNLFPDDILEKSAILAVSVHNKQEEILKSILLLLIGSLVFTIGILATFGITIYTIIKQKKISSIKTDFINNMTHEFKTPIATISLATDSIVNSKVIEDVEKIRYFASIIKQENKRMNAQVEHVLQMALLDSKSFKLNLQEIDIHKLINRAADSIKLTLEKKGGTINYDFKATESVYRVDEIHFTNVLFNLLDNAIKYTEQNPKIEIKTENRKNGIRISIKDNGLGMSKDVRSKIFDKFYRIATGNVHNVKGFGLGLSYVKAIVMATNGSIDVESELGKGSVFHICLSKK